MEFYLILAAVGIALVLAYYMGKDQERFERESEWYKEQRRAREK